MDPVFVKGVIAFLLSLVVFVGSVWLLLSLILGVRMGYLVTATTLFGIMLILSGMWYTNKLGPKGLETTWHAVGAGPDMTQVTGFGETHDISDYPDGEGWVVPKEGGILADLHEAKSPCLSLISDCGKDDTETENENARPVMETFISQAISPIPGKKEKVADQVQGSVDLETGKFAIADVRMKEARIEGKNSIIAVGKAVPSDQVVPTTLGPGVDEGTVDEYLVDQGETVTVGQPFLRVKADNATVDVPSNKTGRVLTQGLRKEDTVKAGIPIAVIDISGQAGAAQPVEVAAVRVLGAVRRPAQFYLLASIILFGLHLALLNRTEKARKAIPQPA